MVEALNEARGAVGAATLKVYGMVGGPLLLLVGGRSRQSSSRWIFHLSGRSRARSSTFTMFIPTTGTCHRFVSLFVLYLYLDQGPLPLPFLYKLVGPLPRILIEQKRLKQNYFHCGGFLHPPCTGFSLIIGQNS